MMQALFILPFILFFAPLTGQIIEVDHFCEIKNHLKPNTLVVLDIDDTLIVPIQTLGTDAWFCYWLDKHQSDGLSKEEALERALADWEAIRHLTEMNLVEEGTDGIVQDLQNGGIPVIGLTTQGHTLARRTVNQLSSLNIDLSKSAPCQNDIYFPASLNGHEHGILYRKGILFTSGTPKGKAFLLLLEHLAIQPDHVLFINDKKSHLLDLGSSVEEAGIAFTGLRYTFSDERVTLFNEEIANIQWEKSSFGRILSDEEAQLHLCKKGSS